MRKKSNGMNRAVRRVAVTLALSVAGGGATTALRAAPGGDLSKQRPTYHIDHIPPAPVLSPQEELKTFKLPPGFHIELVASEPMVEEPIALAFDPDGRMYVDELRGYMPDLPGNGELDPVARISRLESSKGDGHFDKRTVFLDKLVVPRAIGLAGDGVLVSEPPNIYFCRDTKGTGACDEKTTIFTDYASRAPNPEHMANGLVWGIDNWCYSANWAARFRFVNGKFPRDTTISRGQWGIVQDDVGRLFYNTNGSMLRADFVPAQYLTHNPYIGSPAGINVAVASNATFPSRVNPGVNRGYTADLNDEGKLQRVTASCGPTIYRGESFPAEFRGNAFVCEPAGNLVSRQVIEEKGVTLKATGVQTDGVDFLTSTDERFRPVSLYSGPDGAIYLVDLYHGVVQHKAYISAYLSDQVKQRNLENNGGHRGRIWRIVSDAAPLGHFPKLSKATTAELVKHLSHPNGWWRDTSQRLLVERSDKAAVPLLEQLISAKGADASPLAKIHALWALQGMDKLEDEVAAAAAADTDPRVRLAALRAGELMIRKKTGANLVEALGTLGKDPDPQIQLQVLVFATPDMPETVLKAANGVLAANVADPIFRAAALNASSGRELDLAKTVMTDPTFADCDVNGRKLLLKELAGCVVRARSSERIEQLIALIAAQPAAARASQEVLLGGILDALTPGGKGKAPPRRVRLPHEPAALASLLGSPDKKISDLAAKASAPMSWPNKPGDTTPPLTPLTDAQQKRFDAGQVLFSQTCAQCHQPSGLGQDGIAPPLVDSEWVLGAPERVTRIVLNGLHGPLQVGKKTVELEMPGLKAFDDEQIASVLTYIRREWGHEGKPIEPDVVARIRKATSDRGDLQWTSEELQQIK